MVTRSNKTPTAKKTRGILDQTRTAYNFKNRDPIFDVIQAAVTESKLSYAELEREGAASRTTVRNYVVGDSKSGVFSKLMATLKATGADVEFTLPSGKKMKLGGSGK